MKPKSLGASFGGLNGASFGKFFSEPFDEFKNEDGSSTLEFAICVPVIMLFMGTICVLLIIGNFQLKCANGVNEVLRVAITYDDAASGRHQSEYQNITNKTLGNSISGDVNANVNVSSETDNQYIKVKITFKMPSSKIAALPGLFVDEIASESVGRIER